MAIAEDGSIHVVQGQHTVLTPRQFAQTIGDHDAIRHHNLAGTF